MNIISIAVGGFIGACLRYAIGQFIPVQNGFPLNTLIINLLGCFILAWFYTVTLDHWSVSPHFRLGIGTGLIGAFTTFSTFTVETLKLINNHQVFTAMTYVLISVIGGIALSFMGARTGLLVKERNEVKE